MRPVADSDATSSDRKAAHRSPTPAPQAAAPVERNVIPADPGPADPIPADRAPADRASGEGGAVLPPVARKPMKPIGPAALKALREAIRSGTYPSDDVVRDGIERLIRRGE